VKKKQIQKYFANEVELLHFSGELAKIIPSGTIIYLLGPLGAGKTTFTRGFLRGLAYQAKVKSPTYTLIEPYEIADKQIFHFDLYRLHDAKELEQIGIHEYFNERTICLIEWPEKGFPLLPAADLLCFIDFQDDGRKLRVEAQSERGEKILKSLY